MSLNFHSEVSSNIIKSWVLMISFILIIFGIGYVASLITGDYVTVPVLTIVFTLIYTLIMYFHGSSVILAINGAREVTKQEFPHYFHTVEGLAIAAGVPTPKAYVIEDTALNAFATGRDPKNAAIVVTTGLLAKLKRDELEGVIAHEMAHIKNFDIRMMMLAAVLVGVITLLSDFLLRMFLWGGHNGRSEKNQVAVLAIVVGLVLAILAPLIAQLIKLAISRKREFAADAEGARLTRYPLGLANALEKIKGDPDPLVDRANKATAHLFISTPFRKSSTWISNLFSTHPPIDERIRRLKAM
ncbi:MAG TPA: M48 family metalloprotease [Acidobacteriota bacterium]|nr:M48 family metalloprotease [Acidobacteriota bacterium]